MARHLTTISVTKSYFNKKPDEFKKQYDRALAKHLQNSAPHEAQATLYPLDDATLHPLDDASSSESEEEEDVDAAAPAHDLLPLSEEELEDGTVGAGGGAKAKGSCSTGKAADPFKRVFCGKSFSCFSPRKFGRPKCQPPPGC